MKKIGIKIQCRSCDHKWRYRGSNTKYITCPNCRKLIKIAENKPVPTEQTEG